MAFPETKGQKNKTENLGKIVYLTDGTDFFPAEADTSANSTMARWLIGTKKTVEAELLASTLIAASTIALSSTISLTGMKRATFFIDHGRGATTAFGTNGTEYRVEVSQKATGNDTWRPIASVLCASTACSSAISAGTAAPAAGTTVITITSGTAFARGDIVMWANTASAASIEWARVVSVSGTATFTVQEGITNAQGSTQVIYNQAEHFVISSNVESVTRTRVVVNNLASGTTYAIYSRIALITEQ